MSFARRTPKILIALLLAIFVTCLIWIVLRVQTNSSQTLSLATVEPDTGFVIDIPQKALMKNYVRVSMEATPGKSCELTYIPPSGEIHQMNTVANESGQCEWRWKVEESEGKGDGRLIFTLDGKSETHFFQILSSF